MPNVNFIFTLKDKVSDKLKGINKNLEAMNDNLKGSSRQLEILAKKTEKIRGLGKALTVGVTLPVLAMGTAMVKAAGEMESMQQQLSTMLGSELEGAKMFNDIKQMASKTPFGTKDLMSATNTMLGFGIAQEKVLPLMKQLGDISGGNAQRFQSLALAFSQVSSAGKLQGQDLMQMINAGFNPLESIAKRTGKSVGYWKEQMSKGKVTLNMVEQAMRDATSEGGRFYKMMEKQSQTFEGYLSTFQDEFYNSLAEFGKIILPDVIKGLQQLTKVLEWVNSLSPGMKKLVVILMGFSAALGPVLFLLGSLPVAFKAVKEGAILLGGAFKFLGRSMLPLLANPITLWVLGISAAVAGLIKLIDVIVKKMRLVRQGLNLKNADDLAVLSQEYSQIGAKEFKKKYGGGAVKAVEKFNTTNTTNNTTTNTTNNNYYAGANPKNAKYTK